MINKFLKVKKVCYSVLSFGEDLGEAEKNTDKKILKVISLGRHIFILVIHINLILI